VERGEESHMVDLDVAVKSHISMNAMVVAMRVIKDAMQAITMTGMGTMKIVTIDMAENIVIVITKIVNENAIVPRTSRKMMKEDGMMMNDGGGNMTKESAIEIVIDEETTVVVMRKRENDEKRNDVEMTRCDGGRNMKSAAVIPKGVMIGGVKGNDIVTIVTRKTTEGIAHDMTTMTTGKKKHIIDNYMDTAAIESVTTEKVDHEKVPEFRLT
jgi:NADH dehydrogenase/NADH:ubiquinone oxidoreductase subunit G